jgi:hypothetical protein
MDHEVNAVYQANGLVYHGFFFAFQTLFDLFAVRPPIYSGETLRILQIN